MPILVATLSLGGCATASSDRPAASSVALPRAAPVEPARVPLLDYAPALQAKAADELSTLPPASAIAGLVADYGQLRRAVCAAERWKQQACRRIATGGSARKD